MNIGFIGSGNMASAILKGMLNAGCVEASNIYVYDVQADACVSLQKTYGVHVCANNKALVDVCDVVFLAIKPHIYEIVSTQVEDGLKDKVIISLAFNHSIAYLQSMFQTTQIIRMMPNTPAMVNESMSALCLHPQLCEDTYQSLLPCFEAIGKVEVVEESLMPAVVAVSGSSVAYLYMMLEAMADGAVREGMPRKQAYAFAAQSMKGAAQMMLDSNMHPGALKDAVCSPKGTTIEAVSVLEQTGFRGSVLAAMHACASKVK